jgi:hypothetical protein
MGKAMKKKAIEIGTFLWNKRGRLARLTLSLTIGLVCLGSLIFGTSRVRANPAPNIDGIISVGEWDDSWRVITDPLDAIYTDESAPTRVDPGEYARSGYEILSAYVHYEGESWYVRMDVDGRPGDADSVLGTSKDPGVGTTGYDYGLLGTNDSNGVSTAEAYVIDLRFAPSGPPARTCEATGIDSANPLLPTTVYSCSNQQDPFDDWGAVAYTDGYTPDGSIEFEFPEAQVFPAGTCRDHLWMQFHAGSNEDQVSDDAAPDNDYVRLFYVDLTMASTPTTPTVGSDLTYTLNYTIENSSDLINPIPANNTYITSTVPTGTTYNSCSGGASCSQSGGIVTWTLATPIIPPATGVVTLVVQVDSEGTVQNESYLHLDEGLCDTSSVQNDVHPTAVTLSSFTANWDGDQVSVTWETALEIDTVGFNLWRSTNADGGYIQVNDTLIPAASPGGVFGGTYAFTDTDVTPGTAYYYKLEELEVAGTQNWYGPTSTGTGDSAPTAVILSVVAAAPTGLPVSTGAAIIAGLATFVVLRKRRQSR